MFWKLLKHQKLFVDLIDNASALLKAVDKDADGDVDMADIKSWLEDDIVGNLVVKILVSIFKIVEIFRG